MLSRVWRNDFATCYSLSALSSCYNQRVLSPWERVAYAMTKWLLFAWAKLMFRLSFEGQENIPRTGALLIACNHVSHLDPPLVGLGVPRHIFHIAKKELTRVPLVGWTMRALHTILIDRSRGQDALRETVEYLEKEAVVIIFPEGTRSPTGRLQRGHSGAAVLALKSGTPVLPAAIIGSHRCFPKHSRWIRPGKVKVRFGEPMQFERHPEARIPRELLERTTRQIMQAIAALLPPEMQPLPEPEPPHMDSAAGETAMEEQHA